MASRSTSNSFTPKVSFFFDQVKFSLAKRTVLKKFIEQLFKKEGRQLQNLNYVFCSDKKLLEINQQFLNHDYFTDIITFDLCCGSGRFTASVARTYYYYIVL